MSEMMERLKADIRKELVAIGYGVPGTGTINMGQLADTLAPFVIRSIREPTQAMIEAGRYCSDGDGMNVGVDVAVKVWQTMTDEVLK